jgi:PAS domain-containing protein
MKPEHIDYRLVVDSTPALIFSARPDGYVDYFNRRAASRTLADGDARRAAAGVRSACRQRQR